VRAAELRIAIAGVLVTGLLIGCDATPGDSSSDRAPLAEKSPAADQESAELASLLDGVEATLDAIDSEIASD